MSKTLLNAPIFAVVSYLLIGVSIATFGPLEYEGYRHVLVATYITFVVIFLIVGFMLGSRTKAPTRAIWRKDQNQAILSFIFWASLAVSTLFITFELLTMVISGGLNFNLANSANSYFDSYTNYTRNSGNYSMHFIVTSIGALPLFIAQVLGIFYFKNLGRASHVAVIFLFIATLLVYTLGAGKMKQLADLLIIVVSVVIAKQAMMGKLRLLVLLKVGAVLFVGVSILLAIISFRYQAIGIDLVNLNDRLNTLIHYRDGYWLEGALSEALAFPIVMFSGYLSQGYFGLSLSLEQPLTWTFFAGSSYSISVILNQFFGAEFWVTQNYPYLVGYATGWDQSKWHTVFSWLASDLTFTGVVVFMGMIGFIYGRVWREILLYKNPFSILVFTMMNIGFVYAPANNQLMHSPGLLLTTMVTLLFYFIFHANFNAAPTVLKKLSFRIK